MILSVGKICTQFVSFLLLPLYTALLKPSEFGVVDLINTYVLLLVPIFNWQFENGLFRFMIDFRSDKIRQSDLFSTVVISNGIQASIYICLYIAFQGFIHLDYKIFLAIDVCVNIFLNTLLQFPRGLGKNRIYAMGSFLSAAMTVALNVLLIVGFRMGALGLFIATLIAKIATCFYLIVATKSWRFFSFKKFDWNLFKSISSYSLPLIPNSLSWWVINASDRSIISIFMDITANGIYSVANKFSAVYSTFFSIFNLSWAESVSVHLNDSDRDSFINETVNAMFMLFAAVGFGIISCMPFVFSVLINAQYNEAYKQIPILIIGILFQVIMGLFSVIYVALKKSKELAKSTVYAAIINIVVNVLFIRRIGLYAASISTLVAFAVVAILRYYDTRKYMDVRFKKKTIITSIAAGVISIGCYYSQNVIFQVAGLVVVVIYGIWGNMSLLKSVIAEGKCFIRNRCSKRKDEL